MKHTLAQDSEVYLRYRYLGGLIRTGCKKLAELGQDEVHLARQEAALQAILGANPASGLSPWNTSSMRVLVERHLEDTRRRLETCRRSKATIEREVIRHLDELRHAQVLLQARLAPRSVPEVCAWICFWLWYSVWKLGGYLRRSRR